MGDKQKIQRYKIVLLGEAGVGKTCIISNYSINEFDEDTASTTSPVFTSKEIKFEEYDNKVIKLDIWDTVGQEKFRAMARIFYKDAIAAILVYDITKKVTFNEIKNYWYKELQDNAAKDISI